MPAVCARKYCSKTLVKCIAPQYCKVVTAHIIQDFIKYILSSTKFSINTPMCHNIPVSYKKKKIPFYAFQII